MFQLSSHKSGPMVTFNLKRPDGSWFGYLEVEKLASLSGIQLRVYFVNTQFSFFLFEFFHPKENRRERSYVSKMMVLHSLARINLALGYLTLKPSVILLHFGVDRMFLQSWRMCQISRLVSF